MFFVGALIFSLGFLSHGLLGEYVRGLIVLPPDEQFYSVFRLAFGILSASLAVGINLVLFSFIVFFTIALLQEFYYQFFVRKIFRLLVKESDSGSKDTDREASPREMVEEIERARREREYEEAVKRRSLRNGRTKNVFGYKSRVEGFGRGEGEGDKGKEEEEGT